ncbi:MAG: ATP synthase F1 subunit gamma [Firmicutes bacterium]|nr:ATP synthase F1 subunit gamma [Bacillota bacterium]
MAQSVRDIKRRIQSVENTQQITKAMEMIAAAKLRKVQEQVLKGRPYLDRLSTSLSRILSRAAKDGSELPAIAAKKEGDRRCLIVITSDRGLAGGYNANIIREADNYLSDNPDTQLILIGRKARDYYRRTNHSFLAEYVGIGERVGFRQAQEIGETVQDFYLHDLFDRVDILYTRFVNSAVHRITLSQILPLEESQEEANGLEAVFFYEPSIQSVLQAMVPLYIDTVLFQAMVEASASEQGARMMAMKNATDNAGELIRELNLSYNKARQASITTEIAEIVGGAEALKS